MECLLISNSCYMIFIYDLHLGVNDVFLHINGGKEGLQFSCPELDRDKGCVQEI
jgi:hypothetical protein